MVISQPGNNITGIARTWHN